MHSSSRMVALALSVKDWSQKLGELGERGGCGARMEIQEPLELCCKTNQYFFKLRNMLMIKLQITFVIDVTTKM